MYSPCVFISCIKTCCSTCSRSTQVPIDVWLLHCAVGMSTNALWCDYRRGLSKTAKCAEKLHWSRYQTALSGISPSDTLINIRQHFYRKAGSQGNLIHGGTSCPPNWQTMEPDAVYCSFQLSTLVWEEIHLVLLQKVCLFGLVINTNVPVLACGLALPFFLSERSHEQNWRRGIPT